MLPGLVRTIQATEAIKVILKSESTLSGRLLMIDAMEMRFRELSSRRNTSCPACGLEPSIRGLSGEYSDACQSPASDSSVPLLTVEALQQRLAAGESIFLLDVREPNE
ncbi:putative adenylyltransferase/sulfurtransferase MoeZ [Rosistilla ulvae]|uniref:Putative adenylyltransferase/sulfurtransferase MoeZ n=1 Tax=Rosistilla ulvae TaxID=1930277 RepID=A0A517LZU4_9BACT|nr:putative adenylyltransferase/sulfurtransferase MoeZ [Rosistilla ulvae]